MVVSIALFETGHDHFKTYQTAVPVEASTIGPVESTPVEFLIKLAELERPVIVQYSHGFTLAHDRDTVSILGYPS